MVRSSTTVSLNKQLFQQMGHDSVPNMHGGVGLVGRTYAMAGRQHSRSILFHSFCLMKSRIQWKVPFVRILACPVVLQVFKDVVHSARQFYLKVHCTSVTCDVMRGRRANTTPGGRGKGSSSSPWCDVTSQLPPGARRTCRIEGREKRS